MCGEDKPLEAFNTHASRGHQHYCKECGSKRAREDYQNNKERYFKHAKARDQRMRAWLKEIKDHPCMDCGIKYPPMVMEFDHVRGTKTMGIAEMMRRRFAKAKIIAEVEKCELVCANCHRLRSIKSLEAAGEEVPV